MSASSSATSGASPTIRTLSAYLAGLIALPAFRDTFSLDHIKRGYYSIRRLNPTGIVPLGPELSWAPPAALLPLAGEGGA